ncbi:MAG: S8 family serine peptidase, partial [Calditrichaeota bacterium]|nr:S8 family serine peptidase [Calditrichota bacterium]
MSDLNSCTGRWRLALLALATLSPGFVLASTGDGLARPESGYYADVRVHFAFDDMAAVRLFDGNDFRSEMKWDYAEIETLLANSGATGLDRLFFEHSPESLELLKKNGEARRGITLPDLNNWYTVVMPDEDSARELASQLSSSPFIRYAALTPIPMPNAVDISPTTPNYMSFQDYQDAAGYGVGIASAWAETNGTGVGVSIMHHEGGWVTDHEDTDMVYTGGGNSSDSGWWNHGTACVSILAAPNNGYGVTGLAYGADQMLSRGFWDNGSPNTWIACQGYLEVGDVISASWGYGGSLPSGYNCSCNPGQAGGQPAESDQADFDAIQTITANGYIVLNSASNGCVPMDNALYNGKYNLNVRDSGALIIGAIDPGGAPACFTNYGSRVDAHAWGSAVYSSGYGDLFTGGGDDRQYYTSGFGGTSAACPIVSGAVATLQAVYKQRNGGAVLDPWELRSLLRSTGTPQTSQAGTKPISNMPDLAELLVAIGGGGPDVTPPSISHTPIVSSGFTGP